MATKISIIGTENSGKTVFLAMLAKALESASKLPRISGNTAPSRRYTTAIYDQLELGEWPKSTDVGDPKNLSWTWHSSDDTKHNLQTFDFAGQDFRRIFESEDDTELTAVQVALKKDLFDSDLILLLFNFNEVLKIHNEPAKNVARLELSYAPAVAIKRLREAGVATYAIFTQYDRYMERIQKEWNGNFIQALEDVLPDLHFALEETGSPIEYISAVETELRTDKDGKEKILPKINCDPGNLSVLIKSVDDFLLKNKSILSRHETSRARSGSRVSQDAPRTQSEKKETPSGNTAIAKSGIPFQVFGLGLEMLPIPAGSFTMGSPADEPGRFSDETQHCVTLTKPFWLGKYPVTQKQWEDVMGSKPSYFKGANRPVEQVSWTDAMEFCKKLTEQERTAGRLPKDCEYTLPTEAEWEYACRAGTTGATYNTKEAFKILGKHNAPALDSIAWYGGNCSVDYDESGGSWDVSGWSEKQYSGTKGGTHDVGKKAANGFGLHDMIGNVWEWCSDWYGNYPTGEVTDPTGTASGVNRVLRGGSWGDYARFCRSARRNDYEPGYRRNDFGFRLALKSVR